MRTVVVYTLIATCASGCATADPARSLMLDLRRIVETRQRTEWIVDSSEVAAVRSTAMRSYCQADTSARQELMRRMDVELEGESSDVLLERTSGKVTAEVTARLTLERMRSLALDAHSHEDQCPNWLARDPQFSGVHSDARKFVLLLESQGGGALIVRGSSVTVGGGASGRVLGAFGPSESWTLGMGLEAGGLGTFGTSDSDQSLKANILGAIPLLARHSDATRIYDFELAATGRFLDGGQFQPGVRASAGIGFSTLRVGSFMPLALLWVGYELQPAYRDLVTAHTFRIGTRVGVDWLP